MRSEEEIRERLRKEINETILDPRETESIISVVSLIRRHVLKWVLEE